MGKSLTHDEFLNKAKNKHGDIYTYENSIYVKSVEKIEITCSIHGNFWIMPPAFLMGQGCAKCAHEKRADTNRKNALSQRMSYATFHSRAIEIHGNFYDYSSVHFKGIKHHITIKCPIHGMFEQLAQAHIHNKQGCPQCFKDQRVVSSKNVGYVKLGYSRTADSNKTRILSNEEYIDRAIKKHGNVYDYSDIDYTGTKNNIDIICKKHGTFNQSPSDHLQGNGCQKCSTFATSFMEQQWLEYMKISEDNQQIWLTINGKRLKVDGFDAATNTIYEFFGDFWHGNLNNPKYKPDGINPKNKKTYQQLYDDTQNRIDLIQHNGYNIKYIWEQDWIKIRDKINENKI